jgi:hypothetical protein
MVSLVGVLDMSAYPMELMLRVLKLFRKLFAK